MSYGQQPFGPNPSGQNPYAQPAARPPAPQQPYPRQPYPQQPGYGAPQQQPSYGQYPPQQPASQPSPILQTPVPAPAPHRARMANRPIPCLTTDYVPGRQIDSALGEVIGVAVRARITGADMPAQLTEQRQEAVDACAAMALSAQADAVVGLRFETSLLDAAASAELVAYGTAVKLAPVAAPEVPSTEPTCE
jgi:uncharacterized protein YbjQ (UPF0145 family)